MDQASNELDSRMEATETSDGEAPLTGVETPKPDFDTTMNSESKPTIDECIDGQDEAESDAECMSEEGGDTESDSDSESELEPPGWDGIRRRKKVPGSRLRPSYYYPTGNLARGVPVFEPTMEEFKNFYKFIKRVDAYGMRSGIVKVVPPKEWTESLPNVSEPLRHVHMNNAIDQNFWGQSGLYTCTNVARSKAWNAKQWWEMCQLDAFKTPNFFGAESKRKSTESTPLKRRRRGSNKASTSAPATPVSSTPVPCSPAAATPLPTLQEEDARSTTPSLEKASERSADDESSPTSSGAHETDHAQDVTVVEPGPSQEIKVEPADVTLDPGEASQAEKKRGPRKVPVVSEEEWAPWEGLWNDLPNGAKPTNFDLEACKKIEREYWRNLTYGKPPKYGADMKGSIFTEATKHWNVANLDNLLTRLKLRRKIPGVNTPYLYFGMWRATFSWHVEDADLYSINYIHFGAPKFWYSVPQDQASRFERVMASYFPSGSSMCPQFLRHKAYLASPTKLAEQGITLNKVVQLPGEFMLTYPYGYHSGFNVGYNCAESINFATESWLDIGRKAQACTCIGDSVKIDVDAWLEEARLARAVESRKRKREKEAHAGETKAKKARIIKVKLEAKQKPIKEKPKSFVCVYCPDMTEETLVKLAAPLDPSSAATMTAQRRIGYAHKACVAFLPTTWLGPDEVTGEEVAFGLESVEKARWALKCSICPDSKTAKYGAKVQCTKSAKCARACHVTCGFLDDSGVLMDMVEVKDGKEISLLGPTMFESPRSSEASHKEIEAVANANQPVAPEPESAPAPEPSIVRETSESQIRVVVCCRLHNPEYQKRAKEQQSAQLKAKVEALPVGSRLKVKTSGGIFAVTLSEHMSAKESVRVCFDDGKESPYKYSAIIWGEIDESRLSHRPPADTNPYVASDPSYKPVVRTGAARNRVPTAPPIRDQSALPPLVPATYPTMSSSMAMAANLVHMPSPIGVDGLLNYPNSVPYASPFKYPAPLKYASVSPARSTEWQLPHPSPGASTWSHTSAYSPATTQGTYSPGASHATRPPPRSMQPITGDRSRGVKLPPISDLHLPSFSQLKP